MALLGRTLARSRNRRVADMSRMPRSSPFDGGAQFMHSPCPLKFSGRSGTIRCMKHFSLFLLSLVVASAAQAQTIKRDIPYAGADVKDEKRTLDVYSPANAKD